MSKFTVTLNRAHKISERLKVHAKQMLDNFQNVSKDLSVRSQRDVGVFNRIDENRGVWDSTLQSYLQANQALESVRNAISEGNQNAKINDMISRQNRINQELTSLNNVYNSLDANALERDSVPAEPSDYDRFSVASLTKEQKSFLKNKVEELRVELHQLSDEISDKNRFSIEVELNDQLARVAGLKV